MSTAAASVPFSVVLSSIAVPAIETQYVFAAAGQEQAITGGLPGSSG